MPFSITLLPGVPVAGTGIQDRLGGVVDRDFVGRVVIGLVAVAVVVATAAAAAAVDAAAAAVDIAAAAVL